MSVEAVVLDIGNVLIEWNPERVYDARLGEAERRRFFAETDIHAMNLEVDRGADFRASVETLAKQHPKWAEEIWFWHDNWLAFATPAIDHSVRLMHALQAKGVPVFALSNFGIAPFDIACAAYPFLTQFDRSYISGHLGRIKPDPAFYAMLEQDSGVPADHLLFTDDQPENIAAARARGWQTHLFDAPHSWAQRLVEIGLLKDEEAQ